MDGPRSDVDSEETRTSHGDTCSDKSRTHGCNEPRGFKPASYRPSSSMRSLKGSLDETRSTTACSMSSSNELRIDAENVNLDMRGSPAQWARARPDAPSRPPRPGSAPSGGRTGCAPVPVVRE